MRRAWHALISGSLCIGAAASIAAPAQEARGTVTVEGALQGVTERDGQRDFDFEIGTWHTHLRRLLRPLTGSSEWVEYEGRSVVTPVLGGRANLVELAVDGSAGHIEALSLRLYDVGTRLWSLNFAAGGSGSISPPSWGRFVDGRGEFISEESFDEKRILVRFVILPVNANAYRFEQSFSADGGKTWELNWVAIDTRVLPADGAAPPRPRGG